MAIRYRISTRFKTETKYRIDAALRSLEKLAYEALAADGQLDPAAGQKAFNRVKQAVATERGLGKTDFGFSWEIELPHQHRIEFEQFRIR